MIRPYNPDQEIGTIVYASSDEDGPPDVGALLRLNEQDFLWCGEITRKEADGLGISDLGWHLVLHQGDQSEVLALVHDTHAGVELLEVIRRSLV